MRVCGSPIRAGAASRDDHTSRRGSGAASWGRADAGGDDREHLRFYLMIVVEAVDDSTTDAQHLARAYVGLLSVERPAQNPLEPVYHLLISVMTVRDRHPGSGCDVELEDRDGTS